MAGVTADDVAAARRAVEAIARRTPVLSTRTISEREMTGAPGGGRLYGYVMRAAQGNAAVADFMPIFWAFGAEMFDQQGRPTVNSAEGINALRFMLELGKSAPPGYSSFNADEVSAHLLQGTAAMSINWRITIPRCSISTGSSIRPSRTTTDRAIRRASSK